MNDYIFKPFKLAELLSLLDKWVSQNKKNSETQSDAPTIIKRVEGKFPDLAGIEIKEGLEIAGGNAEIYKKILRKFYLINSSTLAEIKKALENGETLVAAR